MGGDIRDFYLFETFLVSRFLSLIGYVWSLGEGIGRGGFLVGLGGRCILGVLC